MTRINVFTEPVLEEKRKPSDKGKYSYVIGCETKGSDKRTFVAIKSINLRIVFNKFLDDCSLLLLLLVKDLLLAKATATPNARQ